MVLNEENKKKFIIKITEMNKTTGGKKKRKNTKKKKRGGNLAQATEEEKVNIKSKLRSFEIRKIDEPLALIEKAPAKPSGGKKTRKRKRKSRVFSTARRFSRKFKKNY